MPDPMTAIALTQAAVEGGQMIQEGIDKRIMSSDFSSGQEEEYKIKDPAKPVDLASNDRKFNPYSRKMSSGTSSIEPAVDSNYNQAFNTLSMGPIDNTSVPENEEINRGDIFSNQIS